MSTFVAEINKLRIIQQNLERNQDNLIEQLSKATEDAMLWDYYKRITVSRDAEIEKLQNDVKNVTEPLHNVTSLIQKKDIANLDLKTIKKDMTAIQNNLQNLKNTTNSALELLQKEERQLSEEMQMYESKVQDWTKTSRTTIHVRKPSISKTSLKAAPNVTNEVKDFMEFVTVSGGHENGWAVEDHNIFLKARNKVRDIAKLAELVHALLPDISEDEVAAHEEWYQKYLELKEKRRASIKQWRGSKQKPAKIVKQRRSRSPENCEQELIKTYSEQLSKEETEQKIAAWKTKKRTQLKNQHEKQLLEQLKQKQLEKARKERHSVLKTEVNNWRHSKKAAEEAERVQKEKLEQQERENRAARANKLIKEFQSQDETFIQRKVQMCQLKCKSAGAKVGKAKQEAPSDPERLLKPTKGWILKTCGADNNRNDKTMRVQNIPKLRVPEWRQNIM